MKHFVKERFGWVCLRCRDSAPEGDAERAPSERGRARFFHEGEAEEREPRLSSPALARRRDAGGGRSVLFCPQCGAQEDDDSG